MTDVSLVSCFHSLSLSWLCVNHFWSEGKISNRRNEQARFHLKARRTLLGREVWLNCLSERSAERILKNVRSDRLLRFPEGSTFMSEGIGTF